MNVALASATIGRAEVFVEVNKTVRASTFSDMMTNVGGPLCGAP
jgi:hypothetical protein